MKRLDFMVRIEKEPRSDWGASVPDLPGCVATAKTVDGVLRRIQAAIEMHLDGLRADGVRIQKPSREFPCVAPRPPGRMLYAWVDVAA